MEEEIKEVYIIDQETKELLANQITAINELKQVIEDQYELQSTERIEDTEKEQDFTDQLFNKMDDLLKKNNEDYETIMLEKLDNLQEYDNSELVSRLDLMIEKSEIPSTADHVTNIYGLVVIPAIIILYLLWKAVTSFIKPFI